MVSVLRCPIKFGFGKRLGTEKYLPPLRTRRSGEKWVSGVRPEIGKNSSRDWSRNWPCLENRGKVGEILDFPGFEYFFPIFSAGPISGPISGAIFSYFGPEARDPFFARSAGSQYHHHPESKKRKSSEANSGSIHPYGRYENAANTRKTISTIAIPWPVKAVFEKRGATVEVETSISPERGLLEKGSFQKSPFSRDFREFRDSRDLENPQTVESEHSLEILENLEIWEIPEILPVKRPLSQWPLFAVQTNRKSALPRFQIAERPAKSQLPCQPFPY